MKQKKILAINGESYCRNITGIERVATDIVKSLDKIAKQNEIELIVPSNAKNLPVLQNIKIITLPYEIKSFPKWTQFIFQKYVIKNKRISFDFSNTCPLFAPGIEYLHDIYCKLYPSDFKSKRDKLVQKYSTFMYKTIAKHAKKIIAVSEYTKKTIVDTYKINQNRVSIVYDGLGDTYKNISFDNSIFDKFPILKTKDYYFTLGSLSTRKNLKWIADHAELYPNELFVISGKALQNVVPPELEKLKTMKNIISAGYLSDGQVKALMSKCKAFIFPSYFEGFGLPPLEALYCGAKIIISDATCLPEIYKNCAFYINPDLPNINLDELLLQKIDSPNAILNNFTVESSAAQLYDIIDKYIN